MICDSYWSYAQALWRVLLGRRTVLNKYQNFEDQDFDSKIFTNLQLPTEGNFILSDEFSWIFKGSVPLRRNGKLHIWWLLICL